MLTIATLQDLANRDPPLIQKWSNPIKVRLTPEGADLGQRLFALAVAQGDVEPLPGVDHAAILAAACDAAAEPAAACAASPAAGAAAPRTPAPKKGRSGTAVADAAAAAAAVSAAAKRPVTKVPAPEARGSASAAPVADDRPACSRPNKGARQLEAALAQPRAVLKAVKDPGATAGRAAKAGKRALPEDLDANWGGSRKQAAAVPSTTLPDFGSDDDMAALPSGRRGRFGAVAPAAAPAADMLGLSDDDDDPPVQAPRVVPARRPAAPSAGPSIRQQAPPPVDTYAPERLPSGQGAQQVGRAAPRSGMHEPATPKKTPQPAAHATLARDSSTDSPIEIISPERPPACTPISPRAARGARPTLCALDAMPRTGTGGSLPARSPLALRTHACEGPAAPPAATLRDGGACRGLPQPPAALIAASPPVLAVSPMLTPSDGGGSAVTVPRSPAASVPIALVRCAADRRGAMAGRDVATRGMDVGASAAVGGDALPAAALGAAAGGGVIDLLSSEDEGDGAENAGSSPARKAQHPAVPAAPPVDVGTAPKECDWSPIKVRIFGRIWSGNVQAAAASVPPSTPAAAAPGTVQDRDQPPPGAMETVAHSAGDVVGQRRGPAAPSSALGAGRTPVGAAERGPEVARMHEVGASPFEQGVPRNGGGGGDVLSRLQAVAAAWQHANAVTPPTVSGDSGGRPGGSGRRSSHGGFDTARGSGVRVSDGIPGLHGGSNSDVEVGEPPSVRRHKSATASTTVALPRIKPAAAGAAAAPTAAAAAAAPQPPRCPTACSRAAAPAAERPAAAPAARSAPAAAGAAQVGPGDGGPAAAAAAAGRPVRAHASSAPATAGGDASGKRKRRRADAAMGAKLCHVCCSRKLSSVLRGAQ